MQHVIMYSPISPACLEELFENPFVAQSFKQESANSYSIVTRNTQILRDHGVAHCAIEYNSVLREKFIQKLYKYK